MRAGERAVLVLATWFGTGYLPLLPGTWGTLASIPLWWVLSGLPPWLALASTGLVIAAAIGLASRAEAILGGHDNHKIVIDETAGLLVTVIGVPFAWPEVIAAFVLFRLLDMAKPWPIGWIDRNVGGGVGVVLDDVVAGAIGCALLHGASLVVGHWW